MLEQLQQMIAQSPQLWMQGLGQAERMGERNRLYALQNSQNFADALLQLAGIAAEQEQFQAQMGEQQRQFNVQEGVPGPDGTPPPAGYRAQAAGREGEEFGWRREDRPIDRKRKEYEAQSAGLGVQGQELDLKQRANEFMEWLGTADLRRQGREAALRLQQLQGQLMGAQVEDIPLQREAAREDIKGRKIANERGALGVDADRAALDAQKQRTKWEERFRSAKTDEERDAIIGEDVEMYFRGREAEKDRGLRSDLAGTGKPGESGPDFIRKELRERSKPIEQKALGGVDILGNKLSESEVEVARRVYRTYQKAQEVADTPAFPRNEGEGDEAYLNRLLGMIARSIEDEEAFGGPSVGGPGAPAPAQADDPFGIGG